MKTILFIENFPCVQTFLNTHEIHLLKKRKFVLEVYPYVSLTKNNVKVRTTYVNIPVCANTADIMKFMK